MIVNLFEESCDLIGHFIYVGNMQAIQSSFYLLHANYDIIIFRQALKKFYHLKKFTKNFQLFFSNGLLKLFIMDSSDL
jgi:hypothetical protein